MITAGLLAPQKMMRGPMTVFLTVDVPLTVAALLAVRVLRRQFFQHVRAARLRRTVPARRRILLLGELDGAHVMADLVPTEAQSALHIGGVIAFDVNARRLHVG